MKTIWALPMEKLCHRLRYIFSCEEASEEAFMALMSFVVPFCAKKHNRSPYFIVDLGDKKFVTCLNGLWEIAGYKKHQKKFNALMSKYVSGKTPEEL